MKGLFVLYRDKYRRIQGVLGYRVRYVSVQDVFVSYRNTYHMFFF